MAESDNIMQTIDGVLCMRSDYIYQRAQDWVGVHLERCGELK